MVKRRRITSAYAQTPKAERIREAREQQRKADDEGIRKSNPFYHPSFPENHPLNSWEAINYRMHEHDAQLYIFAKAYRKKAFPQQEKLEWKTFCLKSLRLLGTFRKIEHKISSFEEAVRQFSSEERYVPPER